MSIAIIRILLRILLHCAPTFKLSLGYTAIRCVDCLYHAILVKVLESLAVLASDLRPYAYSAMTLLYLYHLLVLTAVRFGF